MLQPGLLHPCSHPGCHGWLPACLLRSVAGCLRTGLCKPPRQPAPPCCAVQGCGSGLPGLVALWAGAEVHFQVGGMQQRLQAQWLDKYFKDLRAKNGV